MKPKKNRFISSFSFPPETGRGLSPKAEPEGDDFVFFGFVVGDFDEWGYSTLNELESINAAGLVVERDLHCKPGKFSDVVAQFRRERGQ